MNFIQHMGDTAIQLVNNNIMSPNPHRLFRSRTNFTNQNLWMLTHKCQEALIKYLLSESGKDIVTNSLFTELVDHWEEHLSTPLEWQVTDPICSCVSSPLPSPSSLTNKSAFLKKRTERLSHDHRPISSTATQEKYTRRIATLTFDFIPPVNLPLAAAADPDESQTVALTFSVFQPVRKAQTTPVLMFLDVTTSILHPALDHIKLSMDIINRITDPSFAGAVQLQATYILTWSGTRPFFSLLSDPLSTDGQLPSDREIVALGSEDVDWVPFNPDIAGPLDRLHDLVTESLLVASENVARVRGRAPSKSGHKNKAKAKVESSDSSDSSDSDAALQSAAEAAAAAAEEVADDEDQAAIAAAAAEKVDEEEEAADEDKDNEEEEDGIAQTQDETVARRRASAVPDPDSDEFNSLNPLEQELLVIPQIAGRPWDLNRKMAHLRRSDIEDLSHWEPLINADMLDSLEAVSDDEELNAEPPKTNAAKRQRNAIIERNEVRKKALIRNRMMVLGRLIEHTMNKVGPQEPSSSAPAAADSSSGIHKRTRGDTKANQRKRPRCK